MLQRRTAMELQLICLAILLLPLSAYNVEATEPVIYDITNPKYGGRHSHDIRQALLDVWKDASSSTQATRIVIPKGIWYLSQVRLEGNKAPIELEVRGTVLADRSPGRMPNKEGEWITINYVNHFTLSGGGVFDGRGQQAWKQNDCGKNTKCAKLPINLSFNFINNSYIHDVTSMNSKNWHVNCISSNNVTFQRFTVSAPGTSVNTDGIHLARNTNVYVLDSVIGTGDDCVSIGDQSSEIHIHNVTCGPGHGISIGSLGKYVTEKDVKGIYVQNCTFVGTQNGVRVKTWPSAPATLSVSDLHFEDLIMKDVNNPIIIDQEYCPYNLCKLDKPSLIKISNVDIKNIRGTSATAEAVTLWCSSTKPCENVRVSNVDLKYTGPVGTLTTKCKNVRPTAVGTQKLRICGGSSQK